MRIDAWFPTPIGVVVNENDYNLSDYCIDLMSKIDGGGKNWIGSPYTTLGTTHNVIEDSKFLEQRKNLVLIETLLCISSLLEGSLKNKCFQIQDIIILLEQ